MAGAWGGLSSPVPVVHSGVANDVLLVHTCVVTLLALVRLAAHVIEHVLLQDRGDAVSRMPSAQPGAGTGTEAEGLHSPSGRTNGGSGSCTAGT